MAIINQATKELQVKIVYYGPAMGGKTTNLVQVHDHVQTTAGNKGKRCFAGDKFRPHAIFRLFAD